MQESWTIAELAELAAETLAATDSDEPSPGPVRADGRVRDVPNERLVRWYATVGLVDPPLSRRGRVARYGRRHLLQLVAVKRRQAEGRSLAEIQAELTGATDEMLATVARVPEIQPAPEPAPSAPARFWARQPTQVIPEADHPRQLSPGTDQVVLDAGRPDERRYDADRPGQWVAAARSGQGGRSKAAPRPKPSTASPAGRDTAPPAGQGAAPPAGRDAAPPAGRDTVPGVGIVHGVRLAPGVTLLLEGGDRGPGSDDVAEIIEAARPLLEELDRRRLRLADGHAAEALADVGDLAEEGGQ
jgi:DNA-binding transcriptional MerR regulator